MHRVSTNCQGTNIN